MKLGKNQTEFGNMFDPPAPKGAVSRWEHGGSPNKKRLKKIADLGGVSVNYLLNGCANLTLSEVRELRNRVIHGAATDMEKQQLREIELENSINFSSIRNSLAHSADKRVKEEQRLFATHPLNSVDTMTLAYAMNIINEVRLRGSDQQQNNISVIFRIIDSLIDGKYQLDTRPQDLMDKIHEFISSLPLDNTKD